MKLLFDENLSHKLAGILAGEFPGCAHVREIGCLSTEDGQIWDRAKTAGFVIVSKDTDFRERSFVEGFPPKIIWLDIGNAGTMAIADLLRRERERIEVFEQQDELSVLILSLGPTAIAAP